MNTGWAETESGVVVRVPQHDDEWAAGVSELPVSRFNQFAADALALVFRKDGHGAQACPRDLAHPRRTVHDVTDHSIAQRCNQGQQSGAIGPQGVDEVGFLVLPERTFVQVSNGWNVARTLLSNVDDHVSYLVKLICPRLAAERGEAGAAPGVLGDRRNRLGVGDGN